MTSPQGYWENGVYLATESTAWTLFTLAMEAGFTANYLRYGRIDLGSNRQKADLWFTLFDGTPPHVFLCRSRTEATLLWLQLNAP